MHDVFGELLPVFILIVVGWAVRAFRVASPEALGHVNRFGYFVLYPAFLFTLSSQASVAGGDALKFVAGLLAGFGFMALLSLAMKFFFAKEEGPAFTSVFQGSVRWNGFVLLAAAPGLYGALGPQLIGIAFGPLVLVVNTICVIVLARWGENGANSPRAILDQIVANPLILGCAAGLAAQAFGLRHLGPLSNALNLLGQAAMPVALVCVGSGLDFKAIRSARVKVAAACVMKLAVAPAAMWGAAMLFGASPLAAAVAAGVGSTPTAAAGYTLSREMGGDSQLMAAIITATTLLSFVTMPIAIAPHTALREPRGAPDACSGSMIDAAPAAKDAGLTYVSDANPGIARRKSGKGFTYRDADGHVLRDKKTLQRIRSLAIPPAWTEVWISPSPNGHMQATGRDARGRKQHRYHAKFREVRDQAKFEHLAEFGASLPALRAQIDRDMRKKGLPREKVLAAIVHLLETTMIRVGNDEYAKSNKSYGLTTLKDQHAQIRGEQLRFVFTGKSGKSWKLTLKDRRVAKVVKAAQDLPGQRLFQYLDDDGVAQQVSSTDVNAYLREISGSDISAKDFRTWGGTVLAAAELSALGDFDTQTLAKANVKHAIEQVSGTLGNTPTICRKCYVHPALIESYLDGALKLPRAQRQGLSAHEASVLAFLTRKPKRRVASKAR